MITTERLPQGDVLELDVAAPFSAEDFERVGEMLEPFHAQNIKVKLLMLVESIGIPGPQALWEDLKLTRYIDTFSRIAVLTDIDWYGNLAELESVLLPGVTLRRFEPTEREAALSWLQASPAL